MQKLQICPLRLGGGGAKPLSAKKNDILEKNLSTPKAKTKLVIYGGGK